MTVTITTILILATVVEAIVEYLIRPLVQDPKAGASSQPPDDQADAPIAAASPALARLPYHTADLILRYSAALVGVLLCTTYRADLLALIGLTTSIPFAGTIVTGLLIGRGANWLHDLADTWLTTFPTALS